MIRILIAGGETLIASLGNKGPRAHCFATQLPTYGETALDLTLSGNVDLLILDVGLRCWTASPYSPACAGPGSWFVLTARRGVTDTSNSRTPNGPRRRLGSRQGEPRENRRENQSHVKRG